MNCQHFAWLSLADKRRTFNAKIIECFHSRKARDSPLSRTSNRLLHRRHGGVPLEREPYATSRLFQRHCSDAASTRCPQRVRRTTSSSTTLAPPVNRRRRQQSNSPAGGRGGRGDALFCRRIDCRVFLRSGREQRAG